MSARLFSQGRLSVMPPQSRPPPSRPAPTDDHQYDSEEEEARPARNPGRDEEATCAWPFPLSLLFIRQTIGPPPPHGPTTSSPSSAAPGSHEGSADYAGASLLGQQAQGQGHGQGQSVPSSSSSSSSASSSSASSSSSSSSTFPATGSALSAPLVGGAGQGGGCCLSSGTKAAAAAAAAAAEKAGSSMRLGDLAQQKGLLDDACRHYLKVGVLSFHRSLFISR